MIIFLPYRSEPERCPKCGCLEDTETRCRNCKHVYENGDWSVWHLVAIVGAIFFCLWGLFTVMFWTLESRRTTLVDVLVGQLEFAKDLLGRIW